jgi:hypothetical protein
MTDSGNPAARPPFGSARLMNNAKLRARSG